MQTQTTTDNELSNFIDTPDTHSWNRPRSDAELRNFIEARHSLLADTVLFD